jgi:hypothetical protein
MRAILSILIIFLSLTSCRDENDLVLQIPIEGNGRIYASFGYKQVESFAISMDNSLKIMSIGSDDINIDGSSKYWKYEFLSNDKMILYHFSSNFTAFGFDSTSKMTVGGSILTNTWVNSNIALSAAENNGGRIFRNKYPNCKISASLGEPVIPNAYPVWYITYSNSSEHLYIVINAVTGEFDSKR